MRTKLSDPLFSAVEIEINHSCNRRCSYCPNSILNRAVHGKIAPALFDKILNELSEIDYSGRVSYHFYNEPLLHPDLVKLVARTRKALSKAKIEIYTNGTLLSVSKFRALLISGVNHFIVTQHENEKSYLFAETWKTISDNEKEFVTFQAHSDLSLTNRGGVLNHLGESLDKPAPCFIPNLVLVITLSGNVLPCFEDYQERLVMGNISEQSLLDIWNSERFAQFRKASRKGERHLNSPCNKCNRREVLPPDDRSVFAWTRI